MLKRISVLKQSKTGRNELFLDNYTGEVFNRDQFVKKIKAGLYSGFVIRVIRGKETPVSKPDCIKSNNLDF
ncbi:MAG: hypothetical protein IIX63_00710 [Treponema sp.]|jgi:hypothetical protein|nr:hypothetical protein [Treponema sp.]MBQ1972060.1 hypothetical protein [Treponema sp.]MBQ5633211.1 hypothetical protein [Treponema sp.]MBQ5848120.1 hypothetical protein [Treponema sp.]MEE1058297.1 hypothetical protein [Treponema sp.]